MPTTRKKPQKPQPRFLIRSHPLTPEMNAILQRLSQDASDYIGWTVSSSAIVRALIRYAEHQGQAWARETLFPLVEGEIKEGFVWGKKCELLTHVEE